ncbi:MAG: ABC transporter permease [Thermoplasmata archaeon]
MSGGRGPRRTRLRHSDLQTVLAILAIGSSVALPVVLLSVGGGVFDHELRTLRDAGFEIVVSAAGVHGISPSHGLAERIAGVANVASASPVLSLPVDVFTAGAGARPVLAEGVIPGAFEATSGPAERSLFQFPLPLGDPTDRVHFANGTYAGAATYDLLVSTPLAEGTGIRVGDSVGIASSANASATVRYNVTGIFGVAPTVIGPPSTFGIVLPLSDLQTLGGEARSGGGSLLDASDTIEVALTGATSTDPSAIRAVASSVQSIVPYYGVTSLLDEAQQLQGASAILTGFYLALSSVGLSVGLIFLTLILLRRVERSRRSIGVRRAIGVPARMIAVEMIGTGAALSASGAVLGVVGGIALVVGLQRFGSPTVATATRLAIFDPATLTLVALGVVGLSLLASGVATRSALRLSLPEALR